MNRKEEAVLLNIKFHREKKNGADDGERRRENIQYKVFSLVPRCGCQSARRALMMSLRLNVEALDRWEPQDSQRGRRPSPINDAAPLSSFHTKTDGLRRGLQISEGNDFFVDKKLNGLLLPVVHVAVQLVSVHSSSELEADALLF